MKSKFAFSVLLLMIHIFPVSAREYYPAEDSIQWVEGLSWQQIKQKAKLEGKYIFIDVIATWCAPCKKMDKETYVDETVGEIMNQHFVAVKVQMDKTGKDNEEVKRWYEDAAMLMKEYRIRAYPTLIFLSPDGEVVNKLSGFRSAKQLIIQANIALKPGQKYEDPDREYFVRLEEYQSGVKNYKAMPFLFKKALELREPEIAWTVSKEYMQHLSKLKKKELITKDNIEFLAAHSLTSHSPFFDLFFPNGAQVDKVMGTKGFAESIVDQIILREISAPFLNITVGGMQMMGGKRDTAEADWKGLYDKIREQYPENYARRNLLDAQLIWYAQHFNHPKLHETMLVALDRFDIDVISKDGPRAFGKLNSHFWSVFLAESDPASLKTAAKWMARLVDLADSHPWYPVYIDTYANLLYKLGRKKEAIEWQEKSVQIMRQRGYTGLLKLHEETLAKMKEGVPTWPVPKKGS